MGAFAAGPPLGAERPGESMTAGSKHVIGVDLGGTYLRAALADKEGKILLTRRVRTLADEGRDAVLDRLISLLEELKHQADGGVEAVGIGSPGPLDPKAGMVRNAPTLPGWIDVPLTRIVEERVGIPVSLGNDANAAALGELAYGAGKGARHLIYLTISTGIGGGFVVDGRLVEGQRGAAGEVGHMVVEPGGPICSCGGLGHLEAVASGTAIARQGREAVAAGKETLIASLSSGDRKDITAELVHQAALTGDSLAADLLGLAGRRLGYALVSLAHLFNPEVIVLGGGVTNTGDFFWTPIREVLDQGLMPVLGEDLTLKSSVLGDDAGLYGAAALALRAVRRS